MSTRHHIPAAVRALTIHIDAVTLEGIAMTPAETRRFQGALQTELQRLASLQDRSRSWTAATVAMKLAPQIAPATPTRPAQLGVEVGRSVWAAIGGGRK